MIYKVRDIIVLTEFIVSSSLTFATAGFWALFHADIHWDLLSCAFTPKLHDTSTSIDPKVDHLTGKQET